jgi:cell division septal protein FtsQ
VIQRQVRVGGRPVYGRVEPLARPPRRKSANRRVVRMGTLQWRLVGLLVAILAIGWGIGQIFALRTVKVTAPGRVGEIQKEAKDITKGNWWWGNLITFNNGDFVSKLQQDDPLLRDVSVRRHWPGTIVITATLKQPSLGWNTGDQNYVLDRDGTVIAQGAAPAGMPTVVDGSNVPVQIGQRAVSAHFVEFVGQMVPGLAGQGIGATRLDIKDTTLDLAATTNKGYRILFDTGRGASEELADLTSVTKLLATQKRTPAEYIDLRIAGKAYYK